MYTTEHFVRAHLLHRERPTTKSLAQKNRVDIAAQPETRLWKVTAQAVPPKVGKVELIVLSLFLIVAASAIILSVQELSVLMNSNALEHVAAKALQDSE
jgi:hypothetical protein